MPNLVKDDSRPKISTWIMDNIVTVIFIAFTVFGFTVSSGVSLNYFLNELTERIFRNCFLVLSLIIPVVAGLGLNFGIVVGAMSGQIALTFVRYFNIGGLHGLLLCFLLSVPIAGFFGYLTGKLYNKTRGQEMIASLIVGYFANGIYQFLFLFAVGVIIKVPKTHPLIKPDGIGIRMTVDLGAAKDGGLADSLNNILQIPFMWAVLIIAVFILGLLCLRYFNSKKGNIKVSKSQMTMTYINMACAVAAVAFSVFCIATNNSLMKVRKVPVVTGLLIIALCVFTELIMKTKLGQDFKSVGQNQHIAEVSGIDVDRTRIIAVVISTILAAWGMLIYLQDMGTLNTYNAHTNIGMFSVASILVGGASTSKANIKHAIVGVILFNSMFIMSPEIGQAVFGQALLGEYFRTFMVYGVIGVALGLYVWKANKKGAQALDMELEE